jgi:hypothetical protein
MNAPMTFNQAMYSLAFDCVDVVRYLPGMTSIRESTAVWCAPHPGQPDFTLRPAALLPDQGTGQARAPSGGHATRFAVAPGRSVSTWIALASNTGM